MADTSVKLLNKHVSALATAFALDDPDYFFDACDNEDDRKQAIFEYANCCDIDPNVIQHVLGNVDEQPQRPAQTHVSIFSSAKRSAVSKKPGNPLDNAADVVGTE